MNIVKTTSLYEHWLAEHITIVPKDLELKHEAMARDQFEFLRATCYDWAGLFGKVCAELQDAPIILAVKDLHIENFGTWNDAFGRLVWGINDFDEAHPAPYTEDLCRLATSANLAFRSNRLGSISFEEACRAILGGYEEGLETGGRPFVLEEGHAELRKMAQGVLREPEPFWKKMEENAPHRGALPIRPKQLIELALPVGTSYRLVRRQAGRGSLGRQRYTAIADWKGGRIAIEAKALAPSAAVFADGSSSTVIHYQNLIERMQRCPDPFIKIVDGWLGRRLSPDCSKIDLTSLPSVRNERLLLRSMGFETANAHLATPDQRKPILKDLATRARRWLVKAAEAMSTKTRKRQKDWAKHWRKK